jgi:hypothetical protein
MKDGILTQQEFNDLSEVTGRPGWKVYQALLQTEYDKFYKKLRGSMKTKEITDKNLLVVNGTLNGIEIAQKKAQNEIDNFEPIVEEQTEKQPQ